MRRTPIERFIDHVERLDSGCWGWTGPAEGFVIDGVKLTPQQMAWVTQASFTGPRPAPRELGTTCSSPSCVRPSHLRLLPKPKPVVRRAGVRLRGEEIRRLRRLRRAGATLAELAQSFGISVSGASRIVNNNRRQSAA